MVSVSGQVIDNTVSQGLQNARIWKSMWYAVDAHWLSFNFENSFFFQKNDIQIDFK